MNTVNIQLPAIPGVGKTLIEVDGQDITNGVRGLTLSARAGEITELHLDLAVHDRNRNLAQRGRERSTVPWRTPVWRRDRSPAGGE